MRLLARLLWCGMREMAFADMPGLVISGFSQRRRLSAAAFSWTSSAMRRRNVSDWNSGAKLAGWMDLRVFKESS